MTTVNDFLNQMRGLLGVTEQPNGSNYAPPITPWYANLINNKGFERAPWCAMTVTYALHKAGHTDFVYAYCPYIVNDAEKGKGMSWHSDPSPGDLVLFSFRGQRPDHVGVVESVRSNGTFVTLEGNIGNKCQRLVRDRKYVVGFARVKLNAETSAPQPTDQSPTSTGGRPVLREGSRGEAVKNIQTIANNAGCKAGSADGVFGPKTTEGVKCLQKKLKVSSDGVVGPKTYAALDALFAFLAAGEEQPSQPTSQVPALPGVMKLGSRGNHVKQAQQRFADRGWTIGVDGVYGPQTREVVMKFQKEKKLRVDGIIGANTWRAMWTAPVT